MNFWREINMWSVIEMFICQYWQMNISMTFNSTYLFPAKFSTSNAIRQLHLNCFVKVSGVVTRRTSVFPQLKYVKYDCTNCNFILGPYYQDSSTTGMETKIGSCPECQSKGPFSINAEQVSVRV